MVSMIHFVLHHFEIIDQKLSDESLFDSMTIVPPLRDYSTEKSGGTMVETFITIPRSCQKFLPTLFPALEGVKAGRRTAPGEPAAVNRRAAR